MNKRDDYPCGVDEGYAREKWHNRRETDKVEAAVTELRKLLFARDLASDGHPYVDPYRSISIVLKALENVK